jgi:hypothetical protein
MPRKAKHKQRLARGATVRPASFGRVERIPFRVNSSASFPNNSTVVTQFNLDPTNLGTRVLALSDQFAYYRVTRLNFDAVTDCSPGNTVNGMLYGLGYHNVLTTSVFTSFNDAVQLPLFKQANVMGRIRLNVPSNLLRNKIVPWFDTRDQGDNTFFQQGRWYYVVGATGNAAAVGMHVIITGEIEFTSPIDPDRNPVSVAPHPSAVVHSEPEHGLENKGEANVANRENREMNRSRVSSDAELVDAVDHPVGDEIPWSELSIRPPLPPLGGTPVGPVVTPQGDRTQAASTVSRPTTIDRQRNGLPGRQ